MTTVDIFIAYSHEDLAYKNEFKKFLRPMLREERISVWDDYDIEAGQEWDATIKERLYGAGIILLLVSSDSLASDYFYGKEVKVSLERHEKGQAVVVPVILRHCDWENTPLGGLEALPEKGRPVVEWPSRDQAWQDVVTRLRRAVESVAQRQESSTARQAQEERFTAAMEAADHLRARGQWAEACMAYKNALGLYLSGFSPDRATLQQRLAECEQQLDRQAQEARKAAFEQTLASADTLFAQENWAEATATYLQAESQYEPAFPLTEASRRIRERIAACEQHLQPLAPPKAPHTRPQTAITHVPSTGSGSFPRYYFVAASLLLLLVVVLAVWQPWKSGAEVIPAGFAYVKGGTFQMGDAYGEGSTDEKPVHSVNVSSFYMGKTEVTFDEFDAFCTATGREKPSDAGWGRGRRPVIYVDWYDAVEYCNWRSGQDRLTPVYSIDKNTQDPNNQNTSDTKKWKVAVDWTANGYRLPTEAEWEYAAREGGRKVRFGNGKNLADPSQMNFDARKDYKQAYSVVGEYSQQTVPAGSLNIPNALGLHDMAGNLWEWCHDWYDAGYYAQSAGATNPSGAGSGSGRCVRGGSWDSYPNYCRAAVRLNWFPYVRNYAVGFRVVRH